MNGNLQRLKNIILNYRNRDKISGSDIQFIEKFVGEAPVLCYYKRFSNNILIDINDLLQEYWLGVFKVIRRGCNLDREETILSYLRSSGLGVVKAYVRKQFNSNLRKVCRVCNTKHTYYAIMSNDGLCPKCNGDISIELGSIIKNPEVEEDNYYRFNDPSFNSFENKVCADQFINDVVDIIKVRDRFELKRQNNSLQLLPLYEVLLDLINIMRDNLEKYAGEDIDNIYAISIKEVAKKFGVSVQKIHQKIVKVRDVYKILMREDKWKSRLNEIL